MGVISANDSATARIAEGVRGKIRQAQSGSSEKTKGPAGNREIKKKLGASPLTEVDGRPKTSPIE